MLLKYPIQSEEIKKMNIDLFALARRSDHAFSNDEKLCVEKVIRLKIKEYQKRLQDLKEISLVLTDSGQ